MCSRLFVLHPAVLLTLGILITVGHILVMAIVFNRVSYRVEKHYRLLLCFFCYSNFSRETVPARCLRTFNVISSNFDINNLKNMITVKCTEVFRDG